MSMLQKKSLLVFDIDGTLTDTVAIHQQAFKEAIRLIGVTAFDDNFGAYKHHTDLHIVKTIYESAMGKSFDSQVSRQFEKHLYELISKSEITEIKGAGNIIKAIENESEYGICYATGSFYFPAKLKLEKIGTNFQPLQLVASNEIEEREKIVEKAIENARRHYGTEKFERIISFGDGLWDLKTAANLLLEFIGIGTNETILKDNGAQKHYYDFTRIVIADL